MYIPCQNWLRTCLFAILLIVFFNPRIFADDHRNILLLHSYHKGLAWTDQITDGVRTVLDTCALDYELHIEYMDSKRRPPATIFPILQELYQTKYQESQPDVIILADNNALSFVLERREVLFPGAPIVFCGINNFKDSLLVGQANITGVAEEINVKQNLEMILDLWPNTKQIVVINDRTPTGILNQQKFEASAKDFSDRLAIRELVDVSVTELSDSLKSLPQDAAVIVFTFHWDRDRHHYSIADYLALIDDNCNLPLFSFWEHYLGQGITGGKVINGRTQGLIAAQMALEILYGTPAGDIPVIKDSTCVAMFDYNELRQFGIDESKLPPHSVIIGKPISAYSRYQGVIWTTALAIIGLIALIIILTLNIFYRRRAEQSLRASERRYRLLTDNIREVFWMVSPDWQKVIYVSPGYEEIWQRTTASLYEDPDSWIRALVLPDQKVVLDFMAENLGPDWSTLTFPEYRVLRPDGSFRWIQARGFRVAGDRPGEDMVVGFATDITAQKSVEEELQVQKEEMQTQNEELKAADEELRMTIDQLSESEERFRQIYEHMSIGVAQVALDFRIQNANDAYCQMLGYSPDEIIGKHLRDFTAPEIIRENLEKQRRLAAGEIDHYRLEKQFIHKNGSVIHGILDANLVRNNAGRPLYFLGSVLDITERKRMEERIRDSEEHYRLLAVNSSDLIWRCHAVARNFDMIYINPAVEPTLGYTVEEFLQLPIQNRLTPQSLIRVKNEVDEIIRTGQSAEFDIQHIHKDGRIVDCAIWVKPVFDQAGEIVEFQGRTIDITERKKMELALQESQKRFELAMQATDDGLFDWNLSTNEIYYSPGWKRMLGYADDELENKLTVWEELTAPDDVKRAWQMLNEHIDGKRERFEVEFKMRHKDGHWVDILSRANAVRNSAGLGMRVVGTHVDISKRKQAEQALLENERKFRSYMENAPIGIFIADEQGDYVEVNEAAARITGYTRQELLQMNLLDLVNPAKLSEAEEHFKKTVKDGRSEGDVSFKKKDGSINYWTVNAVKLSDTRFMAFVMEITDRLLYEEQIKAALKEKEALLQELYHRTKNNMQVISSMLALKAGYSGSEEVRQVFKEMENRIQSMALIHHRLYQTQNLSRINLKEYLEELTALLVMSYSVSDRVQVDIQAEEVTVLIDTALPCGLVVNELITNAFKYAFPPDQAGVLSLKLHRLDQNHIELIIADNGIGLPPDFDVIHLDSMGLNLAIALVQDQLDGQISFESSNGLTWRVVLRDDLYVERV